MQGPRDQPGPQQLSACLSPPVCISIVQKTPQVCRPASICCPLQVFDKRPANRAAIHLRPSLAVKARHYHCAHQLLVLVIHLFPEHT